MCPYLWITHIVYPFYDNYVLVYPMLDYSSIRILSLFFLSYPIIHKHLVKHNPLCILNDPIGILCFSCVG